jgi:hypothetical protein
MSGGAQGSQVDPYGMHRRWFELSADSWK